MEELVEQTPVGAVQEEIAKHAKVARQADGMAELMATPIWKELITEYFLKAYRETSAYNVGILTPDGRDNYLHQITARSIFERFCDGIIEDGNSSKQVIAELEVELLAEEKEAEQYSVIEEETND